MTYHEGMRALQDRFDCRRLADTLDERLGHTEFTEEDRAFIESRAFFFLATADAQGRPDCSYKGGMPGFVRITGPSELAFPSYDGNGQFRTLGNVAVNAWVGLLFLDFERPNRTRVNGRATLHFDDPLLAETGGDAIVRVRAEKIFPNCPRYVHRMQIVEHSPYAPRPGHTPPEPGWKSSFRDVLPRRR